MSPIRIQSIPDTFMSLHKTIRSIRSVTGKATTRVPRVTTSPLSAHTIRLTTKTSTSSISLIIATIVHPMRPFSIVLVRFNPSAISAG